MIMLVLFCLPLESLYGASMDHFSGVQQRLAADGFDRASLQAIYSDPRIAFETRGVSMYFVHSEGKLNYDQFLEPEPIRKARSYMQTHAEILAGAEREYGVDRQVITAILLVETRLGSYVGNRLVINTFSTMAALSDQGVRDDLWQRIQASTTLTRRSFDAKAQRKSEWAYGELKAFLHYPGRYGIDPLSVKGSYAGALGYCQFLPSNILKLGRDGSGDGQLDLFDHADSIMSVANYLKHHGWQAGLTEEKAARVIYSYNHSRYYVRTVLKIAQALQG